MTPLPWRTFTLVLMGVCCAALIAWDILAAVNRTEGDTISELTLEFLRRYPVAGLAVFFPLGVLAGHLCWPQFVKGTP